MNDWQVAQQLQYEFQNNMTWPDSPNNQLFHDSSVLITPMTGPEVLKNYPVPLAIIGIGSASLNPHRQDEILDQQFEILIVISVGGDKSGQASLIGKDRTLGTSKGMGLLEYIDIIQTQITNMTESQGIKFSLLGMSNTAITRLGDRGSVLSRNLTYSARITQGKTYEAPLGFRVVDASPNASFSWPAIVDRFDLTSVLAERMVLRLDSSPITSVTDGTGISLGADPGAGLGGTSGTGSGTWYFGLFIAYDDYGTGSSANYVYSDVALRKVVVS